LNGGRHVSIDRSAARRRGAGGERAAAGRLRRRTAGRASPIVVTLYQLKSTTAFEAVDYFQLAGKPEQALGDSLVAHEQVLLTPGQTLTLPREMDPATLHVGVAASFRAIDPAEWRGAAKLEAGKSNSLVATLAGTALALKPAPK
jgi:type VI secretion system protein VasD